MSKIILAQCTNKKQDSPAPARELYTSTLFKRQREYAEATSYEWAILSAKHGVVLPTARLEPYDTYLNDKSDAYIEQWADNISLCLEGWHVDEVEILAGSAYADPIKDALEDTDITITEPLAGLRIGERLRELGRLKQMVEHNQLC